MIKALESVSEMVKVLIKIRPLSRDPNDDMILDLALNGRAEVLVTNNKKHFVEAGKRFGVQILSPAEFLLKMREEKDAK